MTLVKSWRGCAVFFFHLIQLSVLLSLSEKEDRENLILLKTFLHACSIRDRF